MVKSETRRCLDDDFVLLGTTEKWSGLDFKSRLISASLVDFEVPPEGRQRNGHLLSPPGSDLHDVLDDIGDHVDIDIT